MTANLSLRSKQPIHLFRGLLREATYLPDPAARSYFHEHIKERFRKRQNATNAGEIERALRSAHDGLKVLKRANHGRFLPLQKVFAHAYGLAGAKRRKLVERMLKISRVPTDVVQDDVKTQKPIPSEDLPLYTTERFASIVKIDVVKEHYTFNISDEYPLLKAFMAFQKNHKRAGAKRQPVKDSKFKMDRKNLWDIQMPRNRVRNAAHRWLAQILESITPPLPTEDTERLHALATGELKWDGIRRRRPGVMPTAHDATSYEIMELLDIPGGLTQHNVLGTKRDLSIQGPCTTNPKSQCVVQQPSASTLHFKGPTAKGLATQSILEDSIGIRRLRKDFGHDYISINTRTMRRLWTKLYKSCCIARWNDERQVWSAKWGSIDPPSTTDAELELFSGVDNKGRVGDAEGREERDFSWPPGRTAKKKLRKGNITQRHIHFNLTDLS